MLNASCRFPSLQNTKYRPKLSKTSNKFLCTFSLVAVVCLVSLFFQLSVFKRSEQALKEIREQNRDLNEQALKEIRKIHTNFAISQMNVKVPFIVLFDEHVGSSAVMDVLNRHPEVMKVGFEPKPNNAYALFRMLSLPELPSASPTQSIAHERDKMEELWADRLHRVVVKDLNVSKHTQEYESKRSKSSNIISVGAKIRAFNGGMKELTREMVMDSNLHVISLERYNLIKWAVSRYRRRRLGLSQFTSKAKGVAIEVPPEELVKSLRALEEKYKIQLDFLERLQLPNTRVLRKNYEDFAASPVKFFNNITAFLGLDPFPEIQTSYKKSTPNLLCVALKNYQEIKSHFQTYENGRYLQYFDSAEEAECNSLRAGGSV